MYLPEPSSKQFTPPPAGNHIAICYRLLDLGTQPVEWQGQKKLQHKIMLSWELPGELMTEGEMAGHPFTIHQRYTWSMSDKSTLRKHLESWRGKAFTEEDFVGPKRFNARNIVGKPCMLSIVHVTKDGTTYANIAGVAGLPKGVQAPAHVNPLVYFALTKEDFDAHVFDGLSDKLKDTIKVSPEYAEIVHGVPAKYEPEPGGMDDEIPFQGAMMWVWYTLYPECDPPQYIVHAGRPWLKEYPLSLWVSYPSECCMMIPGTYAQMHQDYD